MLEKISTGSLREVKRIVFLIMAVVITAFVIKCLFVLCPPKKDINYATKCEIRQCTDIGTTLSQRIYDYVQQIGVSSVGDLEGKIRGLGDKRLHELEEVYR